MNTKQRDELREVLAEVNRCMLRMRIDYLNDQARVIRRAGDLAQAATLQAHATRIKRHLEGIG